jgi:hypothetical protein
MASNTKLQQELRQCCPYMLQALLGVRCCPLEQPWLVVLLTLVGVQNRGITATEITLSHIATGILRATLPTVECSRRKMLGRRKPPWTCSVMGMLLQPARVSPLAAAQHGIAVSTHLPGSCPDGNAALGTGRISHLQSALKQQ